MFVILPISVESKEQTWLLFVAPSFSQWHPYTRTMSGLFSNSVDRQVDFHSLLESSKEQAFNSPGDIRRWGVQQTCCVETAWDWGSGTLLQGSFHPQHPGNGRKILAPLPPCLDSGVPSNQQLLTSQCALWKQKGIGFTLTSFCSLCRHSSSVSSISLSAKTHTQRPNTEKSNLYPGDVYKHEALTGACKRSAPYCSMHICLRGSRGWDDTNGMLGNFPPAT